MALTASLEPTNYICELAEANPDLFSELHMMVQLLGSLSPKGREGRLDEGHERHELPLELLNHEFQMRPGCPRSSICLEIESDSLLLYLSIIAVHGHL